MMSESDITSLLASAVPDVVGEAPKLAAIIHGTRSSPLRSYLVSVSFTTCEKSIALGTYYLSALVTEAIATFTTLTSTKTTGSEAHDAVDSWKGEEPSVQWRVGESETRATL